MNLINRKFIVDGMLFDCAIDMAHELHCYGADQIPEGTIPVEIYNCSEDWDIHMVFPKAKSSDDIPDDYLVEQIREWAKPENHEVYSVTEFSDDDFYPELEEDEGGLED